MKIEIIVPDENCKECPYHSTSYKDTYYYTEEKHYCSIFKCELPNYPQKCVGCEMVCDLQK